MSKYPVYKAFKLIIHEHDVSATISEIIHHIPIAEKTTVLEDRLSGAAAPGKFASSVKLTRNSPDEASPGGLARPLESIGQVLPEEL